MFILCNRHEYMYFTFHIISFKNIVELWLK